jgi:hypothetical protein
MLIVQLPDKWVLTVPIKTADDTVVGVIQAISCMQGSPTAGDAPAARSTANSNTNSNSSTSSSSGNNSTAVNPATAAAAAAAPTAAAAAVSTAAAAAAAVVHHTHHHHHSSSSTGSTGNTGGTTAGVAAERRGSGTSSSSSRSSRSGSSGCSAVGFSEEDEITLQHIAELVGAALHTHRLAQETFTTNRRLEVSHSSAHVLESGCSHCSAACLLCITRCCAVQHVMAACRVAVPAQLSMCLL